MIINTGMPLNIILNDLYVPLRAICEIPDFETLEKKKIKKKERINLERYNEENHIKNNENYELNEISKNKKN